MTDKIVTEAMLDAGKRAFGDTELVGDDYIGRALTAAYTAMSTAQEPALDDDAREALERIKRISQRKDMGAPAKVACIADIAHTVLQAKAPETGEAQ